ncbi:Effector protein NopP [Mesorhizobium sp. M7A.F.Ca.CA.001.07.2.1]|uniref:Effector protein NopP n=1 Tax=Mesorhizobium TaxID=68287 RepID=UPI000FCBB145|nr:MULTISPECIES: Effector protein NopP [Mesorhizobium]RVB49696.1 Effector protein NopP [Mesorhizobium sp. M7A.F.Ca.CA.004.05.1.1]MCF6127521.1 Effector protein NopP [Mesorhizobium ciceri]MCQ8818287.1 Effector protein NopP [Mesorhizobium sp. SEMIA396]RUX81357.1 Effector protein NopP [Mesorhizobium sp. M7A.F.Ca.CA.004.08.2.1]RUX87342.1 Effector protein NopP [Mesorhizobium sp. M7A.F.Ca.CA.004.08.1.1]
MYGRIGGSSDSYRAHNAGEQADAGSEGFADTFARMHLSGSEGSGASSSAAPQAYSLNSRPPVVEINRTSFRRQVRQFHGDEITHIADNPQEYSEFVSSRARRTADVAQQYGIRRDTEHARYFSYQLGDRSAGLLRMEGGFSMNEFESESWREQFPGRTEVTSIVDLQVAHPLVENAGDILLEHQLRIDGDRPLLNWRAANPEAQARAQTMGFVEVDHGDLVLDPTQHPDKWTKNSAGEWQRAGKPPLYLHKTEDSDSSDSGSDDDFM